MKDRKIHGKSNVWSTAQRQKKIYGFDVHAGLEWNYRSLAMASSVHWYGHVLRRENGHDLGMALNLEVESKRKAKEDMEKAG